MSALPGFRKLELSPASDDLLSELEELLERLPERDYPGHLIYQREHIGRERTLHRGELVQIVQHDPGLYSGAQLEYDPHTLAVGLVAQIRYALDLAVLDQPGDLLYQGGLVDLVWQFADDYLHPATAVAHGFYARLGADDYLAASGSVGALYAGRPHDDAAGGKVRPLDELHQVFD